MRQILRDNLTWKDLCEIVETAISMLDRNINDELMGRYDGPQEFYEILLKALCDREYGN